MNTEEPLILDVDLDHDDDVVYVEPGFEIQPRIETHETVLGSDGMTATEMDAKLREIANSRPPGMPPQSFGLRVAEELPCLADKFRPGWWRRARHSAPHSHQMRFQTSVRTSLGKTLWITVCWFEPECMVQWAYLG